MKYVDPDGNVTEEQNKNRNQYQNGYAPPSKKDMDRLVSVGLFVNQGNTGTHNLNPWENTKAGRQSVGARKNGYNIDYRGKKGTIFEGMQFVYNQNTGNIITDEVNKGTFDLRSPYRNPIYFAHRDFDIDTWIEWGTGGPDNKEDVFMPKELWDQVNSVLNEFENKNITKKEAQKRIIEILPTPQKPPKDMKGGIE